jgi:hypothetical protein
LIFDDACNEMIAKVIERIILLGIALSNKKLYSDMRYSRAGMVWGSSRPAPYLQKRE